MQEMRQGNNFTKMNNLKKKYNESIKVKLAEEFGIKNIMAIPRLKKIVVNVGIGDIVKNKEQKDGLIKDISQITGQKPSERQAKVSIATFGIRKGQVVGLASTLRGNKMYDFFEKFVNIVLPRLRDFRGVNPDSFDKNGNYSIGLSEHTVFLEVNASNKAQSHSMEINITTSARTKEEGKKLLELLGMPFSK